MVVLAQKNGLSAQTSELWQRYHRHTTCDRNMETLNKVPACPGRQKYVFMSYLLFRRLRRRNTVDFSLSFLSIFFAIIVFFPTQAKRCMPGAGKKDT